MKLISINFYYNNEPELKRTEYAMADAGQVDNDDREFNINGRLISDSEIFYYFNSNPIVGNHGEFTVTSFIEIEEGEDLNELCGQLNDAYFKSRIGGDKFHSTVTPCDEGYFEVVSCDTDDRKAAENAAAFIELAQAYIPDLINAAVCVQHVLSVSENSDKISDIDLSSLRKVIENLEALKR